jgi:hypothetical protein
VIALGGGGHWSRPRLSTEAIVSVVTRSSGAIFYPPGVDGAGTQHDACVCCRSRDRALLAAGCSRAHLFGWGLHGLHGLPSQTSHGLAWCGARARRCGRYAGLGLRLAGLPPCTHMRQSLPCTCAAVLVLTRCPGLTMLARADMRGSSHRRAATRSWQGSPSICPVLARPQASELLGFGWDRPPQAHG